MAAWCGVIFFFIFIFGAFRRVIVRSYLSCLYKSTLDFSIFPFFWHQLIIAEVLFPAIIGAYRIPPRYFQIPITFLIDMYDMSDMSDMSENSLSGAYPVSVIWVIWLICLVWVILEIWVKIVCLRLTRFKWYEWYEWYEWYNWYGWYKL